MVRGHQINKHYSVDQINTLGPALAEQELDRFHMSLTPLRETFGRGLLLTQVPRYEKPRACTASALCYDPEENILRFLALNPFEADRVGIVEGVKEPDGGRRAIFFVLVGACQFLNSVQNMRKSAHVKLLYDPTKVFTEDSLQLVVATRNNAGVDVDQALVLSYGAECDFYVPITKSVDFLARQKSPLSKLWQQPPDTTMLREEATGAASSQACGAGTLSVKDEPEEEKAASSQHAPVELEAASSQNAAAAIQTRGRAPRTARDEESRDADGDS